MLSWSLTETEALANRMAARRGGFKVSAETAALIVDALRLYVREGLAAALDGFAIDDC